MTISGAKQLGGTSDFLLNTIDLAPSVMPSRPGAYLRISEDPLDLQRGVDRQRDDTEMLRSRLGWGPFACVYRENDTSAFKKRMVTLPDGSRALRVIRPEFRQMMSDLLDGTIDGVIVYDLDRLARQPRDLEDLIDVVETTRRPVKTVTGDTDLITSQGRMAARMMVSVALKSSEDTSRRVARSALADAEHGVLNVGGPRRYGWNRDGQTLNPAEAAVLREVVDRVLAGEGITAIALDLQARNISTVTGAKWTRTTVNTLLRSPRLGGIRGYQGRFHTGGARPKMNEWWRRAVRVNGEYVMGDFEPLLTSTDEWEALQAALDAGRERGARQALAIPGPTGRKYLLSGLCVCGSCGTRMVGRVVRTLQSYGCRPRDLGGCNKVSRNMDKVDAYVTEMVLRVLDQAGKTSATLRAANPADTDLAALAARKVRLRTAWTSGAISDADFFPVMAELTALITAAESASESQRRVPAQEVMVDRLRDPGASVAARRAIMGRLIERVVISPSSRGPHFNPADLRIVWRDEAAE